MALWEPQDLGDNLSAIVATDDAQDEAIRSCERGNTEPTIATRPVGCLWLCTNTTILTGLGFSGIAEMLLEWDGSNWKALLAVQHPAINRGGTIAFAAAQSMGGNKLTGLAAATANGDAVRYEQAVLRSGALAMTGPLNMGNEVIEQLADPTNDDEAATKGYVDDEVSGVASVGGEATITGAATMAGEFELGFVPKQLSISVYQDSAISGRKFPMMGVTFGDTTTDVAVTINVINTDSSDVGTIYTGTLTITRKSAVTIGGLGPGFGWSYTPGRLAGALGTVADHVVAFMARK